MLWKKMIRDILSNKGPYLACLMLVVMGLIVFMTFSIASDNLYLATSTFYQEQNFAHGFARVVSMPKSSAERLARVEGIRDISGRLVKEVRVHDPEREESVYLNLVSLDLEDPNRVNDVMLLEGEELAAGEWQGWVDNQFFAANNLQLGQEIEVIAGGRVREIDIVGVGMSPEFTYYLRTVAELIPNPNQFGIAFLPMDTMSNLFPELQGSVNDLVFTLEEGADYDRVEESLELELEQYGLQTIYPREEQTSHFMLMEEVEGLEMLSTSFPVMILSIAGVIIFIMLKRLVEQQRGQIGILKAFGYSNREVLLHYLHYALFIGVTGGLVGGLLGIWLANPLTVVLFEFFNVPRVFAGFSLYYLLLGLLLSVGVFLIAGYYGCKQVLTLEPAEAMRPPAPVSGKKIMLEKVGFFTRMLTIQGKMGVRNLSRNPGRSAFMFFGIAISYALVAFTWNLADDAVSKLIFYQYDHVETYDAKVTLAEPLARRSIEQELDLLPEVTMAEPLAEVPVRLSHKWRQEDVAVVGILQESRSYNILDADGSKITPSAEGLILSERLAENLGVSVGSRLELESPFLRGEDEVTEVDVFNIIPQYLGMNAYMELTGLEEILGQGKLATSFMINIAGSPGGVQDGAASLRERYLESELVAGVDSREDRIGQVEELMEVFGSVVYMYVLVGVIFSFAIIYIASFIVVSERSRELASMRVLGMTSREVFSVITFEQWFLNVFAVLAGIPLTHLLQMGFAMTWTTDLYTIPAEMTVRAYFAALFITIFSIWVAQRFALRKVGQLSLVEVLKTRE